MTYGEPLPAPPLEWHPFYRDHTHLIDWLKPATYWPAGIDGTGATVYEVPVIPRVSWDLSRTTDEDDPRRVMLTKRKAWGAAPWSEAPYVYVWFVATDNLGRSIAGESWVEPCD